MTEGSTSRAVGPAGIMRGAGCRTVHRKSNAPPPTPTSIPSRGAWRAARQGGPLLPRSISGSQPPPPPPPPPHHGNQLPRSSGVPGIATSLPLPYPRPHLPHPHPPPRHRHPPGTVVHRCARVWGCGRRGGRVSGGRGAGGKEKGSPTGRGV